MRISQPTIGLIAKVHVNVQIFISLQALLQQLDLLVALYALAFGILSASAIALDLVQLGHLLDTFLILLLYAQLELELGQHQLDSRTEVRGIEFD